MITSPGIGDQAPDFTAETTDGTIKFHEWLGNSYGVLFSHPKDFTPICTTELGYLAGMKKEFDKRNVKVMGLSIDSVGDHHEWAKDIEETQGHALNFPLVADHDLKVAKAYGMLHPNAGDTSQGRKASDNATVRTVFIIGPDFDEILRTIDSIQLTAKHKVATPANWKPGGDVVIIPTVGEEEARQRFPDGWKAPKPYLRIVKEPV